MILVLLFILAIIPCLAKIKYPKIYLFFMTFLLVVAATLRSESLPDGIIYKSFASGEIEDERFEPATYFIKSISDIFGNSYRLFFFIYAFISVCLKIYVIKRLSNFIWLSILAYIAIEYPIHEMIQIRIGAAAGLILLSVIYIYEKKKIYFFSCIVLASLFHYSALVMLPLYWLNANKFDRVKNLLIIVVSFLLALLKIGIVFLVQYIPIAFIQYLFAMYKFQQEQEGLDKNIFSLTIIFVLMIHLLLLWNVRGIYENNKYAYILLKIQTLSICSFFLLSDLPIIGGRISELFRCVLIITIPLVIYSFKNKKIGLLVAIACCFAFFIRFYTLYYI